MHKFLICKAELTLATKATEVERLTEARESFISEYAKMTEAEACK